MPRLVKAYVFDRGLKFRGAISRQELEEIFAGVLAEYRAGEEDPRYAVRGNVRQQNVDAQRINLMWKDMEVDALVFAVSSVYGIGRDGQCSQTVSLRDDRVRIHVKDGNWEDYGPARISKLYISVPPRRSPRLATSTHQAGA